jgi:hypothetical protein
MTDFTAVHLRACDDTRLSLQALGLLHYLNHRKRDTSSHAIQERFGIDAAKLNQLLCELCSLGYIAAPEVQA